MKRTFLIALAACAVGLGTAAVQAQTLQQRIDGMRARQAKKQSVDRVLQRSVSDRMHDILDPVLIRGATAKQAFEWWSRSAHISLVINWDAMLLDGVDPDSPINLDLRYVPANRVLELLLRATAPPEGTTQFVYDIEPGYVHVLTKRQANRMQVTRVYDVLDLVMEIPYFDDAPDFDLRSALSNTSTGGGGGRGGSNDRSLFDDDDDDRNEPQMTKADRGERLVQLVRDTIEPTIWRANGGDGGAIRYFDGRLIVTAPKYVHRQIGIPVRTPSLPPIGGSLTVEPASGPAAAPPVTD